MPRDLNHACEQQFIGSLNHELRLHQKMSQAALEQASAVNRSIMSRLEHGHAVSFTVLLRLAASSALKKTIFASAGPEPNPARDLPGAVRVLLLAMLPKQ